MPAAYVFGDRDKDTLIDLVKWWRQQRGQRTGGSRTPQEESQANDLVIVRVPSAGVAAVSPGAMTTGTGTGTGTGTDAPLSDDSSPWAICPVYHLREDGSFRNPHFRIKVYNVGGLAVLGDTWALAGRDRWGRWVFVDADRAAGGGVSTTFYGFQWRLHGTDVSASADTDLLPLGGYEDYDRPPPFFVGGGAVVTILADGKYEVGFALDWFTTSDAVNVWTELRVDGAPLTRAWGRTHASEADGFVASLDRVVTVQLATGQHLTLYGRHDDGGGVAGFGGIDGYGRFWVHRIDDVA